MKLRLPSSRAPWLLLAAGLLLTALVYWAGLHGAYIYDDFSFFVDNTNVHVSHMDAGEWLRAALSFPSTHQGRYLTMLTFAANYFFSGLDPFWPKLTNLCIHLLNGVLVFLLSRALLDLWRDTREPPQPEFHRLGLIAATVAMVWLLLPINLTAVLYVIQRLESFSNTFVFLGLWLYLRARRRHWHSEDRKGVTGMVAALALCTGVGLLAKESAVLLPLYALCIELTVTQFRRSDERTSRPVQWLFALVVGLPLLLGLIWLATWIGGSTTYARAFSPWQRLLTEARVLVHYITWTLLPLPDSLSLYHDDIAISRGLLSPPSTLLCAATLLGMLALAVWQRQRRPLLTLGIAWFFAGHALTGTIIPLELAFEHRNYFPSLGLLLAVAALLTVETPARGRLRYIPTGLACAAIAFFAFITALRANEWSHPLRLAVAQSMRRPHSPGAQYELAHTLLVTAGNDFSSPRYREAEQVLKREAAIPDSDIMSEQALIILYGLEGKPIDPTWWDTLIAKLRQRPASSSDINGLQALLKCQRDHRCPQDNQHMLDAFLAALSHPHPAVALLFAYGGFAWRELHDPALTEQLLRTALKLEPDNITLQYNLALMLIATNQLPQAQAIIARLRANNFLGMHDEQIHELEGMLATARRGQTSSKR